jgi:hypothetical protein
MHTRNSKTSSHFPNRSSALPNCSSDFPKCSRTAQLERLAADPNPVSRSGQTCYNMDTENTLPNLSASQWKTS